MPLPFEIYLQPPNVLVLPLYSGWNLFPAQNSGLWGEIVQTNRDTISYNVGDVVFYNEGTRPIIYSSDTNVFYNIIDEGTIFFKEAPVPPPP
jgi:hypothetical protein